MSEDFYNNKTSKKIKILVMLFGGISIIASGFFIWQLLQLSTVETVIRYIVIGVLGLIDIVLAVKVNKIWKDKVKPKKKKKKNKDKPSKRVGLISFMIIYSEV